MHYSRVEYIGLFSDKRADGKYNCGAVVGFKFNQPIFYGKQGEYDHGEYIKK